MIEIAPLKKFSTTNDIHKLIYKNTEKEFTEGIIFFIFLPSFFYSYSLLEFLYIDGELEGVTLSGLLYLLFDPIQPYRFRLSLLLAHTQFISSTDLAKHVESLLEFEDMKYLLVKLYVH